MSSSSSFSSGTSSQKTSYNKHFQRSFLLNYRSTIQDINDEAILKRLHDFNWEWLQRLNIAISGMAQTLWENMPLLKQQSSGVLAPDFVEDLLEPL